MQHAERWDLPKGHLDLDESKKQAAIRELVEETGIHESFIRIDPDFEFTSQYWVNYDGKRKLKELTVFLALLTQEWVIQPTEHLGFRWFPFLPPHSIQTETIDPLLAQVALHFESHPWAER
jgi:8-oxo-dGTP pyrophosphatase MutT (NUDIX family)